MKTLKLTSAWILICSIIAVSCGPSEHGSSHHVAHHGANTPQKTHPDTTVLMGIQMPEHVLSNQDVSCISADNNIFQIMHEAQNACKGTDMRCTFYHFVNHGYQNIGSLDVNKDLFDDLLMKFDNWLLTAESIDKAHVHAKTNEYNTTSIHVNDKYKHVSRVENPTDTIEFGVHTNQSKLDESINKSGDDTFHGHHIKNLDETHHRTHHHKWKNGNHLKPYTEYNKEHRYFEVFLPKDEETGKPRTIYVEVDQDKNEFVLLDEDIDKKLNGIKPIKIELDELSDLADSAFGKILKSLNHKEHIHNINNKDNRVMASDLNTNAAVDKSEIHLDIGNDESVKYILNSTDKKVILNNGMENDNNILNVSKNLIVSNKYINQEQFHVESQTDNTAEDMINNNFEILENINETDVHQTGFYETESFDTVEFDHNNITDLDIDADYIELNSSQEFINIPCENEYDNCTEHHDFSTDHDIETYDDNDFIQLEENNDTSNDIDFDDTQEFSSPKTIDLKQPVLQVAKPVQETELKTTPCEPTLTSYLTDGISEHANSWLPLLPSENQKAQTKLHDHSSASNVPIKPFTAIPIQGKGLAKVVEMDSHLQPSFPVYAAADLSESDSHIPILNSAVSSRDYILPLPSKELSGGPKFISSDHSMSTKDTSLFQIEPLFNIDVQEPYLSTAPFQLGANTPMSIKNTILPSKFALPKSLGDFDKIITTDQFHESPLSVTPYTLQHISPNFLPTKDNLGLVKYSPEDNNIKGTMTPCSANRNRCRCNTNPYCSNPYLKPPQLIPAYFEPPPQVTPLQSTSKIPILGSLPISLDQSNLCFNVDHPREMKPIPLLPFAPDTPFSPLNPLWLGPGSYHNTCPNLWNSIPYQTMPSLPYSILPAQNICNNPPILSNYLAPNIGQQQNQILKPLPSKEISKLVLQQPCATKNILQMTPSNPPYSPIYTRPIQIDLNPSLNLERDLQTLSFKYGIPLTKILDALDAEISDSPTSWPPFELPRLKFVYDSSLKGKSTSSATNTDIHDKYRIGNKDLVESDLTNLTPLDSTLIGPHLEIDDSLLLGLNDYQTYNVASETTGPQSNQHLNLNKNPDNKYLDSSLIDSQLSTLATSNIQLSDEDRIENVNLHLDSDSSSLVPLESHLIGPHLKLLSPPLELDSNIYKSDILTSYTEEPITSPSQIKTKLNQSYLTSSLPNNSGLHLKTLSSAKPLLSDEIQITNEMIPLESDITELTSLDSSHVDLVNDFKQAEILQHEKTAANVNTTILYKPFETEPNFIEGELLPTSLIESHLQTGNLPIITNASVDKSESLKTHESIENTDIKFDEMESIILPSSMLTTLLSKPVNADSNLATNFHSTKLNKEPNNLLLDTNSELSITDSSSITSSLKETGFHIIEPNLEITDSTILEDISNSPEIILDVNSETQLDSSIIGPSLPQETDSPEMSPILDSVDHLEIYEGVPTSNLNKNSLNISTAVDSKIQYDSSLTGPNLFQEMTSSDTSTALDSVIELDDSFVIPNLQETIESSTPSLLEATSKLYSSIKGTLKPESEKIDVYRAFDSNNVLDTSLVGPHLRTAPFSNDEIKMIHEEMQKKSELANLTPLETSLIGPRLDFESRLDESEISIYQNPESSSLVKGGPPLKPINMPIELQELLSKFTNAITKSHLSSSEMKPCDKLLSSLANMAAGNNYVELPCEDFQDELAAEYSPITIIPEQGLSPVQYSTNRKPCYNANYFPIPMTYPEHSYTKGVPQLPITPMIDCNWLGQPFNIQNVHQVSPVTFNPNTLPPFTSEDLNRLQDLVSHTKHYPQSFNSNIYTPESNYIPLLPKKSFTVLPSNLESTISPEYKPIVVDDIMSLIDVDTHKLLKDMSILPSTTPTIPTNRGEIVSPLLDTIPITNTNFVKSRPCNSQPYSHTPLGAQFSETIGPPPKLISLPNESLNAPMKLQWYKIPNKPKFIESFENPTLDKEFLPQLSSQSYLDSPIILPSSALDTMLQMPIATNKLNSINFSPIQTPLSNAITSSILPSYAKPLSVSYTESISTPSTNLALNIPLPVSPAPSTPSFNPYTTSPNMPAFASPLTPINTEPSDYRYLQTATYNNKPISSAVPYKPTHSYSSPCLPVHTSPLPFDYIPYSQVYINKAIPTMTNPYSLEYIEPMSASYFSSVPKSLTNLPTYSALLTPIPPSPVKPTQIDFLSPSYVTPVTPSYSYLPLPASKNTLKRPPSVLSPAYITPISSVTSNPSSNLICLPLDTKSTQNPQITKQKLQLMKPMNTMPISFENNPFSNANQMLPISPNTPISSYTTYVPKSLPYFSSQIKQNVPCGDIIQSNIQTSVLTHEVPTYDVKEESMSYILAPEHMTETFLDEDFVSQEDLIPFDSITNVATEPSTKANVYQRPLLAHYTPLYGKPGVVKQHLPPRPLTELIQPNIFDNVLPMPPLKPYQASLPTSIQSGQFLKPSIPVTSAPNLSSLLSPYTSVIPIYQEPITPFMPVLPINLPKSLPPTLSDILENYIELPPTHYVPKSKFVTSRPLVKSSSMSCYNKYTSPIISHFLPIEEPSPHQYITPLSLPKNEKCLRPVFTPKYMSTVLPAPTKFQNSIPLSEAPIHYQTYNPPAALPSSVKNIFDPSVSSQYTVLPLSKNIVQPLSIGLNKPQWSSFSPQYTLPASLSSPIPVSSSTVPFPTILPVTAPQTAKPAFTNHIIPSSLFMSSDLQVPINKLASHYNIPRYSLPSPTFTDLLEIVPYETPSRPLEKIVLPQNVLKPNRPYSSYQFKVPLPSSQYLTQPLELTDYYPAQLSPNIQYTAKTHPKLSPVSSYLPLETTPNRLINQPSIPQYNLPIVPVFDALNQPLSAKNPFLDPNFKPIPEVPPYPVPNKLISSPKITPFDSILVSNLQPPDVLPESLNSYLSPLTPSVPLYSSALPKLLPQKSRQYQPKEISNYWQYLSQLSIESVSELLPSTSPLLKIPLLKPLLAPSQNNISLFPMHFSRLDSAFPERSPSTSEHEYFSSFTPLVPEIPETVVPINLMPTTSNSLSKSRLNKYYQSPVSMTNMPLISNYDIVESPVNLPMKSNIVNFAKPVEVTAISEISPLSQYGLNPEIIEEIQPYEHMMESFLATDRVSSLPTYLSQQKNINPALSKYLTMPQSLHHTLPLSKNKNSKPKPPLLEMPEEVELIDTTDFIPLSQIKSEPLVVDYTPTDRQIPIFKNIPPVKPDISQFFPYTTLLNTDFPPSKSKHLLTKLQTPLYSKQLSQNSPVYISPQEYKDLIQGPSISKGSSSSSTNFLTPANTEPQLTINPMTVGIHPVPLYNHPISFKPEDWHQPPILAKSLPPQEIPVEIAPEKENIQTFLNKYKLYNNISPVEINNHPYELISEMPLKLDTLKPIPLKKSGPNTEYDDIELNNFDEYDSELLPYELETKNIEAHENKANSIDADSFAKILPEIIEGLSVPTYNDMAHRPQRLSNLDHFYANNHIGKNPQVFTVPAYKTLPTGPSADVKSVHNVSPDILNDFTNIPTDFGNIPKIESSSLKLSEFPSEIAYLPENVPITNSYPINYMYPRLKPNSQRKFPPNAIEIANISEMPYQPTSYAPNETEDIKYSGYKTYQIPSFKPPKLTQNLRTPIQEYDLSAVPYKSPVHSIKPSNVQQIPNSSLFYSPVEISEPHYLTPVEIKTPLQTKLGLRTIPEIPELEKYGPLMTQYQKPVDITTPLQTKLELNTLKESLEFEEYNPIEDLPIHADNENEDNDNEDNELKTSLLSYINKREDVKNNLYNGNTELTIPIGNIAITKKEPYNANTIETNNPSIGLKVWKSNVKIAQVELKLKFKDLSVNNFMPVVNNLDKYDMEEIRKIVKNYIDDKYGAHIEVNEPYTIDNKYAVIKDFEHNAVDNKYNLLWPTNYV